MENKFSFTESGVHNIYREQVWENLYSESTELGEFNRAPWLAYIFLGGGLIFLVVAIILGFWHDFF